MAKRKPKLIRGRGRPSFTMKPGTPMPQSMHPAIRKVEFEATKLKELAKKKAPWPGSPERQAGLKKRLDAVTEYKAPKTKPTAPAAPTPTPAKAAPKKVGALRKFFSPLSTKHLGKIGKGTGLGRLFSGVTGSNIIKGAAGKGLLRGSAMKLAGIGLRAAGPVGAVYTAGSSLYTAYKRGKRAGGFGKPVFTFGGERGMAKRSKEKYGTVEAATRTRKAMTGR